MLILHMRSLVRQQQVKCSLDRSRSNQTCSRSEGEMKQISADRRKAIRAAQQNSGGDMTYRQNCGDNGGYVVSNPDMKQT